MKNSGVLARRAALLTAIVAAAAVAVMAPAYVLIGNALGRASAREPLASLCDAMKEAAAEYLRGDESEFESMMSPFAAEGGTVLLLNADGSLEASGTSASPPGCAQMLAEEALDNGEAWGEEGGAVYRAVSVARDGKAVGALLAGRRFACGGLAAFLLALLCGLAAGGCAFYPLWQWLIVKAMVPMRELRNVALKIAGGDFEARANERAAGELGELGLALNNMSFQLSRTLYTLILERNRLKHMIDGLSEGVVAVNAKGHVTHQNPALKRMFPGDGARRGADARLRLIPDKSIWEDFDTVVRKGGVITRNIEVSDIVVRLVISPIIDEIGATAGAVGLFSDITQMERLERTRREYVANVSHEMRTPLTAMRALIEPLKEGMVTQEDARMRYYDIIYREVLRLSRLINDQLELSRLQSGTVAIQKERMPLEDLVLDVCDRYSQIAAEHDLKFDLDTDFSQCPIVYSNADRIEQMMVILLDNAIKYTQSGGTISVGAAWDDKLVTMCVKDTGEGISREDLPYVFDRFYKVDKAHSGKGSGLGLSIAKELLMRMGEEIWVASERGRGSQFYFTIHRAQDAVSRRQDEGAKDAGGGA